MFEAIAEELSEVETIPELKALWCFGEHEQNVYATSNCVPLFKAAIARLRAQTQTPEQQGCVEEVVVDNAALLQKLAELQAEVERLKAQSTATVQPQPQIKRAGKRYRLLKFDVSWTTKRQVHVLAAILEAHAKVGDILDEEAIIEMMEANVAALDTKQGGKKVWDYYKGESESGLRAHGNIELA